MGHVRIGSLVRLVCPEVVTGWSDGTFGGVKGVDVEFEGVETVYRTIPYGSFGIVTRVRWSDRDSFRERDVTCYWSPAGQQTESVWVLGCEYETIVY